MRYYVDFLVLLYAAAGIYGAVWVTDDLDPIRFQAMTLVGVPAVAVYLLLRGVAGPWHRRWRKTYFGMLSVVAVAFALGHLAYLNAITADPKTVKRSLPAGQQVVQRDVQRGGFGLLHRRRW